MVDWNYSIDILSHVSTCLCPPDELTRQYRGRNTQHNNFVLKIFLYLTLNFVKKNFLNTHLISKILFKILLGFDETRVNLE